MSVLRKSLQATWIDAGLFAQARIYDNSSGTPTWLSSLAMTEIEIGVYVASFIPLPGVSYLVTKRVYTDGTFVTPDVNYAPSSEDFQAVDFQAIGAESGVVLSSDEEINVLADIEDENTILTGGE